MHLYRKDLIRRTWKSTNINQDIVKNVIDTFLDELREALIKGEAVTLTRVAMFYPQKLKDTNLYDFTQGKVVPKVNRWTIKCLMADDVLDKFKERKRD